MDEYSLRVAKRIGVLAKVTKLSPFEAIDGGPSATSIIDAVESAGAEDPILLFEFALRRDNRPLLQLLVNPVGRIEQTTSSAQILVVETPK